MSMSGNESSSSRTFSTQAEFKSSKAWLGLTPPLRTRKKKDKTNLLLLLLLLLFWKYIFCGSLELFSDRFQLLQMWFLIIYSQESN